MLVIFNTPNNEIEALEAATITRVGKGKESNYVVSEGHYFYITEEIISAVERINKAKLLSLPHKEVIEQVMKASSNNGGSATDLGVGVLAGISIGF